MKRSITILLLLGGVLLLTVGLTSCGSSEKDDAKTARLVYVNWAEGIAYTHLAQNILEDLMDYEVTITSADVGPAYTAVAQGNADAFMETWLPVLHSDYVKKYKEDIVDLGYVYQNTQSGLVVPTYVTIDSISQLNDQKEKFKGKITGIDAGAGIMQTTEKVFDAYELKFKLISSSGPAMTSALSRAIQNEEWIVVTGWKPHWMFGRWDLKFLKQDSDKKIWDKGNIHIMGRKKLEEDKPELAQFLKNMEFSDQQLADLMLKVNENEDNQDLSEITRTWMTNNRDVVNRWIPNSPDANP